MELIDLYTREVGRNLPEKERADIEKEIRSSIEDSLDDESRRAGRPADEDMLVEVLTRLGPPEKVAASYLPPRYLIGPELYPHFITTLRIVLVIVIVMAGLGIGASLAVEPNAPRTILDVFIRVYAGLFDAILTAAGMVVLIFAIIQYTSPGLKIEAKEKAWDPRKLRDEPDPERVSLTGTIGSIVATFLALAIFNLYSYSVGIYSLTEQGLVYAPVLSEAFFRYLPWLNVLWVLEIAFSLWLMARGKWSAAHRWAKAALALFTVVLLAWMLTGPSLVALSPESLSQMGWSLGAAEAARVNDGLQISMRLVLGIAAAANLLELGKQLYKLIGRKLPAAIAPHS